MENGVLNSWKEIAAYTGRGVRTVQRWEQDLGFPVRRPRGKQRSAVIAIKEEIDQWMRTPHGAQAGLDRHRVNLENQRRLVDNTEVLHARATTLLSRYAILAERVARAIQISNAMQASSRAARVERKNWVIEVSASSHALKENVNRATELGTSLKNSAPLREATGSLKSPPAR